ncbi:DegT/DnrJ/EryC1/StrS family aminotransferase [Flavobacteriaceae bacterium]|nr:DegT/DnrJ/EryC1/StrS family aminotransferase [Flavobacteriaceae bacterium]
MRYELASSTWGEEEIESINKVVQSGNFTMGENVREFEKQFASFFNSKYCVMVNSGSSANLIAIASLFFKKDSPLKIGDEVIVPAVSWATTYHPLNQYGLKLKFVDIDINTLNYDLKKLEGAISINTKAIIAVNLLGNSNDFKKINELIQGKNILLIEDNCESMGAKFDSKYAGTHGILGTFSGFFSHHISTMEGGMILTDTEELYHIMLSLRAHGWTRDLPTNNHLVKKEVNPFDESFRFILPGYNLRPLEFSGAIGIEQLKKLPSFINSRRENAKYFLEKFKKSDFILQREIGESSWFGFSLIMKDQTISREKIINKLIEKKIDVRPIVSGNFVKNEVIKYYNYEVFSDLINSERLDKFGFFVGNHHYDIKPKIDYLFKILSDVN